MLTHLLGKHVLLVCGRCLQTAGQNKVTPSALVECQDKYRQKSPRGVRWKTFPRKGTPTAFVRCSLDRSVAALTHRWRNMITVGKNHETALNGNYLCWSEETTTKLIWDSTSWSVFGTAFVLNSRPNLLIQSNGFVTKGQLRHFNFMNKTGWLFFFLININNFKCEIFSQCVKKACSRTLKLEMIICQGRRAAGVSTSLFGTHSSDNDVHKNWLWRLSLLLIATGPQWLKVQLVKEQRTDFPKESQHVSNSSTFYCSFPHVEIKRSASSTAWSWGV